MADKVQNINRAGKKRGRAGYFARFRRSLDRITVKETDYFDYNLLAVVILLISFGLIMLYSTSAYKSMLESETNSTLNYFGKQAVISIGALVIALIVSRIDYHWITKYAAWFYLLALLLLFATQVIGTEINGAKRWIYIGPISFQAAEFAKVAVILFFPALIRKDYRHIREWRTIGKFLGYGFLTAGFTYVFTDNLSTALIILGISVVLLFIAHPQTKPFLYLFAAGAAIVAVLLLILINQAETSGSFRIRRILVWLDPESYSSDGGYQVIQALYAIGSGGFFGKGLGNGTQKLGAIPEAQNDMIFSIICEELGVFGASIVILLFVFLLYRLFVIAQNAPDLLGSLIASGVFVHIALQVTLNIAVVTNMIPTTGITLPFVSYGGTSIVFLMIEMGLALGVSRKITFR